MQNKGRSQHRFRDNPLELSFAQAWEKMNTNVSGREDGRGVLDYLLAEDPNDPRGEVTERDREVAATVIQWLGSPVGQGFIREVLIGNRNQGASLIIDLIEEFESLPLVR
jgi:hypothetical protein